MRMNSFSLFILLWESRMLSIRVCLRAHASAKIPLVGDEQSNATLASSNSTTADSKKDSEEKEEPQIKVTDVMVVAAHYQVSFILLLQHTQPLSISVSAQQHWLTCLNHPLIIALLRRRTCCGYRN